MTQSTDDAAGVPQPAATTSAARARNTSPLVKIDQQLRRPKGRLAHLVAQTDRLARINRAFRAYLPPHLLEHASLAAISAEAWTIHTDSSAWATRLRYVLPSLRKQLSEHLKMEVPALRVRIRPAPGSERAPPRRLVVSKENANLLEGAAQSLKDERLGAALQRLAANARRRAVG